MAKGYNIKWIEQILWVVKRMDEKGVMNAFEGNVSILEDGYFYITPTGMCKTLLTPDQICVFDENQNQVAGLYPPSSEFTMHWAICHMSDDIHSVMHTHSPFLTAFALCNMPVASNAYAELLLDHKSVDVVPFGMPGTEEIYAGIPGLLEKGRKAMLLANHGALSVGKTIYDAMNKMESAENAAKIITITKIIGKQADLDEDLCEAMLAF